MDFISAHTIICTSISISNIILNFLFLPLKQIPSRLEQLQTLYLIYRKSFIKNCIRMKCEKKCQEYRYSTTGQRTLVNIWYLPMYTPQCWKYSLSISTKSPAFNVPRTVLLCWLTSSTILSYTAVKTNKVRVLISNKTRLYRLPFWPTISHFTNTLSTLRSLLWKPITKTIAKSYCSIKKLFNV
jgi:hypothetical protein